MGTEVGLRLLVKHSSSGKLELSASTPMAQSTRRLGAVALLVFVGGASLGCANIIGLEDKPLLEGSPNGACSGTLKVRILANHLGSTAAVDDPKTVAMIDVLDSVNDHGGIRGCPIDYGEIGEAQYKSEFAVETYGAWRQDADWDEVSGIFVNGTPVISAIAKAAESDHKVVMATSFSAVFAAPQPQSYSIDIPDVQGDFSQVVRADQQKTSDGFPYLFYQGTDYSTGARAGMDFIVQKEGKRVGFFYDFESSYAAPPVDAAKVYLETQPLAIGRDLDISMNLQETTVESVTAAAIQFFTEEFEHARDTSGYEPIDWIWFGNTRDSASVTCVAMGQVVAHFATNPVTGIDTSGFAPKVIANNWAVDELTHSETGGACSGDWWVVQPFALYGDMSAIGMSDLLAVHKKYRPLSSHLPEQPLASQRVVSYVVGYVAATTWVYVAESLIDEGREVTGETLKEGFESLDNRSMDGLTAGPITYTSSDHRPQQRVYVYHLTGTGQLEQDGIPINTPLKAEWLGW